MAKKKTWNRQRDDQFLGVNRWVFFHIDHKYSYTLWKLARGLPPKV